MNAPAIERLGRYQITAELGRGAMGVVYRAIDPALDRTVAIKTINVIADLTERAEYEARFQQEAKAAARLNHPNIVTIYDIGRDGDVLYMAMELLEGEELRGLLDRARPPVRLAVEILAQVADALAFAHDYGVIHRDIKPANIMIVRNGPVKITDFGVARLRSSDVRTQTGLLLGSPRYMAPEQIAGRRIDHRADIFALGVVLYEALTGVPPFAGDDLNAILFQVASVTPPPPSAVNAAVPAMLDLVLAKALAKDPEARYQTAREMAADMRASLGRVREPPARQPTADATTRIDATKTLPLAGADIGAETSFRLAVSRRFDSSEALRRLAGAPIATSTAPHRQSSYARRRRRERLAAAASVTIAALVAAVIAFG